MDTNAKIPAAGTGEDTEQIEQITEEHFTETTIPQAGSADNEEYWNSLISELTKQDPAQKPNHKTSAGLAQSASVVPPQNIPSTVYIPNIRKRLATWPAGLPMAPA